MPKVLPPFRKQILMSSCNGRLVELSAVTAVGLLVELGDFQSRLYLLTPQSKSVLG